MVEEFPNNVPPENFQENDADRQIKIPGRSRFPSLLKNSLVFLVLAGVVVASFWVSFQLGKNILLPTKKSPDKITAAIPEPPPSIKALQKLQAIMSKEAAGKKVQAAKPAPKMVKRTEAAVKSKPAPKPVQIKKQKVAKVNAVSGKHYYKLQAGLFADKTEANSLAGQLRDKGIDVFVKKVGRKWRVQVGAYRTKKMAQAMKASFEKKGCESQIVFE